MIAGLRLLLIDDDARTRKYIRRVAEEAGYDVLDTDNPRAFVQPMKRAPWISYAGSRSCSSAAIGDVCGRIDYVQPGGATLGDRGVYGPESPRAEYLAKVAPDAHRQELEAGYIRGATEEAPSVITLNMRAAAACVNEFIARAYPFRLEPSRLYARTTFSLAACEEEYW